MNIYPAIDLQNGKVVRLMKGDMDEATIYNEDPAQQARHFKETGFSWLHIVDLDGAKEGKPSDISLIEAMIAESQMTIQLGGGIRSLNHIEYWLSAGIHRVILGTAAVRNPELVKEACKKFPRQIAVGIDARVGKVAIEGWVEESEMTASELAKHFEDAGVSAIIYTDIGRDGTQTGVNIKETKDLAQETSIPIIASGGVGSLEDIQAVKDHSSCGIEGVIVGRAFYEGSVMPKDALAIAHA